MESKLWDLVDNNGETLAENLTPEEAGEAMVSYDGARWEIRAEGRDENDPEGYWFWALYWGSTRGEPMKRTVFFSVADTHEEAYCDIMRQVARKDSTFFGCEAVLAEDNTHCECGQALGLCCDWTGPKSEMVCVEYIPEYLRESHTAAGNCGTYPGNGAIRIMCERSCVEYVVEGNEGWAFVCKEDWE